MNLLAKLFSALVVVFIFTPGADARAQSVVASAAPPVTQASSNPLVVVQPNAVASTTDIDARAQNVAAPAAPPAMPANNNPPVVVQPGTVLPTTTVSDILGLAKIVLDTAKEHAERSSERLKWVMLGLGGVGTLLGLLGFREFKSVIKPYKEKLDALKADHEQTMSKQIKEFSERSHHNARALVTAPLIWDIVRQIDQLAPNATQAREALYKAIVEHVERTLPDGYEDKMDPYLAGLLLIRKAYALKRLGKYEAAFLNAKAGLALDGESSRGVWLYNAACYAALALHDDESYTYLVEAIKLDPSSRADALTDDDLARVRSLPQFTALLGA